MGIFYKINKWILKRGLIGAIAKNAIDQFNKWGVKAPHLSEREISSNMFSLRYTNPRGVFSDTENVKIGYYLNAEFYPDNLLEFCLMSLDIEGGINPLNKTAYKNASEALEEMLIDLGYHKEEAVYEESLRNLGFSSSRITSFSGRWFENIMESAL